MTRRTIAGLTLLMAAGWLSGSGTASATMDLQKKAKAAGFDAQSCAYCHMEKLPKKGAATFNDRGKWLGTEKEKRKAKEVDVTWLKEYVEKK
jgi:hypothetical protein